MCNNLINLVADGYVFCKCFSFVDESSVLVSGEGELSYGRYFFQCIRLNKKLVSIYHREYFVQDPMVVGNTDPSIYSYDRGCDEGFHRREECFLQY